jgi:6-pyruvoyltetrahydropterin/6-carboxytetrahydropterin synthase
MPRVRVTRRLHFSAGHRLFRPDWGEERNREVFGACSNPTGHGHNYDLEVTVEGEIDPETGFVLDLKRLKELVSEMVISDMDHANLNTDVEWLEGRNPTAENLSVAIWNRLEGRLDGAELVSVKLWETDRNVAEYRGE